MTERRAKWQFSIRSLMLTALVVGPLVGGLTGTFGTPLQEVLLMMAVAGMISAGFGILAVAVAFCMLSPLFLVERYLRRNLTRHPPDEQIGESPTTEQM